MIEQAFVMADSPFVGLSAWGTESDPYHQTGPLVLTHPSGVFSLNPAIAETPLAKLVLAQLARFSISAIARLLKDIFTSYQIAGVDAKEYQSSAAAVEAQAIAFETGIGPELLRALNTGPVSTSVMTVAEI